MTHQTRTVRPQPTAGPAAGTGGLRRGNRFPALAAWGRELAAGTRTIHTFDVLWRAACAEITALELEGTLPALAAAYRVEAAQVITRALRAAR